MAGTVHFSRQVDFFKCRLGDVVPELHSLGKDYYSESFITSDTQEWKVCFNLTQDSHVLVYLLPDETTKSNAKATQSSLTYTVKFGNTQQACTYDPKRASGPLSNRFAINRQVNFRATRVQIEFQSWLQPTHSCLLDNKDISDVSFSVDGKIIYAISGILSGHCEFFRALLKGFFQEATKLDKDKPIKLTGATYLSTKRCISWIYTKQIMDDQPLSMSELMELYLAADHFGLPDLLQEVRISIESSVDITNFSQVFAFALEHEEEFIAMEAVHLWKNERQRIKQVERYNPAADIGVDRDVLEKGIDLVHECFHNVHREMFGKLWWNLLFEQ
jgi:hypothetical protein